MTTSSNKESLGESTSKELECVICASIKENMELLECCDNLMCGKCVKRVTKGNCPICRAEGIKTTIPRKINRLVGAVTIKCECGELVLKGGNHECLGPEMGWGDLPTCPRIESLRLKSMGVGIDNTLIWPGNSANYYRTLYEAEMKVVESLHKKATATGEYTWPFSPVWYNNELQKYLFGPNATKEIVFYN